MSAVIMLPPMNDFHRNVDKQKSYGLVDSFLCLVGRKRSCTPDDTLEVTYDGSWKYFDDLTFAVLTQSVISSFSGPSGGIADLDLYENHFSLMMNNHQSYAYGISLSLYEQSPRNEAATHTPESSLNSRKPLLIGDPVADVFGVIARKNSAILALADGVNWGPKPKLAAVCAVYSALRHLDNNINRMCSSHAAFNLLWNSFLKGHELIMEKNATLTTLTAAFVCELQNKGGSWGLFMISLGDSPAFVYSPTTKKLVEVTIGCHPHSGRDMTDCGGVLGPGNGIDPDFANLTFAYTMVSPGDYVFIISDGISDNFHPGVIAPRVSPDGRKAKLHVAPDEVIANMKEQISKLELAIPQFTAQDLCANLMNYSVCMTEEKRKLREELNALEMNVRELAVINPDLLERMDTCPGKLDHASIVAYQVGHHK